MKTHFFIWMRVLVVLFGVGLFIGCGKAEPKLSIRAAESEKDLPTTALVRKIELSYHDVDGNEKMRQSVAVYGLGQPISLKADLMKDLDWDSQGTFQATAYSGDGGLYLQGIGHGDPDSDDAIEIIMERGPAPGGTSVALTASAVLKSLVVLNEPGFLGYSLGLEHLSTPERESPSSVGFDERGCRYVPKITVHGDAALWPTLRFYTQYKGPRLTFELRDAQSSVLLQSGELAFGQTGDPEFVITDKIASGTFLRASENSRLYLFSESGRAEGCLNLETTLNVAPVQIKFEHKSKNPGYRYSALGCWFVQNPNGFEVVAVIQASPSALTGRISSFPIAMIHSISDDSQHSTATFSRSDSGRFEFVVPAYSTKGNCIFGYSLSGEISLGTEFIMQQNGFQLNWQAQITNPSNNQLVVSGHEAF